MIVLRHTMRRVSTAALGIVLLASITLLTSLILRAPHGAIHHSESAATADPRLVLRPRSLHIHGSLAGTIPFGFTLSPALPSREMVRIRLPAHEYAVRAIALEARMLDMRMAPTQAVLHPHGRAFQGSLYLPMFGHYVVDVVASTGSHRYTATVQMTVPLPKL